MFIAFTTCFTVGLSIIFAWLFDHTRGSVLLAMLRGSVNAATGFAPTTALPLAMASVAFAVPAVIIIIATRGQLGYPARMAGGPSKSTFKADRSRASAAS